MRTSFLPFAQPTISEDEIADVAYLLRSGWITTGAKCSEFEHEFAKYCEAKEAVAITSATAAMHLLLHALGIGEGDEVITPSMTWVSTANLISIAGATPVFADIDHDSLMVTPETIEPCITSATKLIVPVHFAGASLDMEPLRQLANRYAIPLIEDAAHAIGTEYNGKKIGAEGTAMFSFHPIKNITTGEGGMLCSDNAEFIAKIRRLKFHGLGVDAYDRTMQGRTPQAEVIEPGFKYNLTDIAATLGIGQLRQVDNFIVKRTHLANRYDTLLANIEELQPLRQFPKIRKSTRHSWHLYIVRFDIEQAKMSRDTFIDRLKKRNIGCGLHFRPIHSQTFYRQTMPDIQGTLPETEWNGERILSLPLFPSMTENDQDDVIEAIYTVLSGR